MVRLHRFGMRQVDIAAQVGRDPGNVWHVLKRTGALDGSSPSRASNSAFTVRLDPLGVGDWPTSQR